MIDWNRVRELQDEIGIDDFAEVAVAFLEETDAGIAVLPGVPQTGLSQHLHALKGSALNLGFADFARLCQMGEVAADNGGAIDRDAITACYTESKSRFLAALSQLRTG